MRVFWKFEMWCRKQAAAAILPILLVGWLTGESSEALTTFGKSNTQAPKDQTPTPPLARACSKQADCIAVPSSSCVRTHYDPQTRCLCGDNSSPINGQCEAQGKTEVKPRLTNMRFEAFLFTSRALYHACANSDECLDGMSCGPVNGTDRPPHLRMWGPKDTICLCDTENGFREKDHSCSDADILKTSVFAILIVSCIRKLLVY